MTRFGWVMGLVLAVVGLASGGEARAMSLLASDVQHADGEYRVNFEFFVDAPVERVRAQMSDYARLDRLVASITENRILERFPDGRTRLKQTLRDCVAFFCRSVTRVEDIVTEPNGDIVTTVLPEHSDFSQASERWRIVADGAGTRVAYRARLTPGFFIPPLVGPLAVKSKLGDQLRATANALESLAQAESRS